MVVEGVGRRMSTSQSQRKGVGAWPGSAVHQGLRKKMMRNGKVKMKMKWKELMGTLILRLGGSCDFDHPPPLLEPLPSGFL